MRGVIEFVEDDPTVTGLSAGVATGATVLPVAATDSMPAAGLLAVSGVTGTYPYTKDVATGTLVLATGLADAAEEDATVSALDAQGKPMSTLKVWATFHPEEGAQPCDIGALDRSLFVEGDEMAGQAVDVDETGGTRTVVGLPRQKPMLDLSNVDPGTIPNQGTDGIPNGTFEERDPLGLKPFAQWHQGSHSGTGQPVEITNNPIAGSRSLGLTLNANTDYQSVTSDRPVPVAAGDVVALSVSVTADRNLTLQTRPDGANFLAVPGVWVTPTPDSLDGAVGLLPPLGNVWSLAAGKVRVLTGSVTIPEGAGSWMWYALQAVHPNDGLGPATIIFDQYIRTVTAGDTWHEVGTAGEPPFENGWGPNTSIPVQALTRFRRNPDGSVFASIEAKGGPTATTIFTFPEGYRPARPLRAIVMYQGGTGAAPPIATVDINQDGTVKAYRQGVASTGEVTGVVMFPTA